MQLNEIGENIKQSRLNRGFTQQKLADEIEKSLSLVKKYESGRVLPPIDILKKIAEILNVSVLQLLGHENISSNSTAYVDENLNITEVIPKDNGEISESEAIISAHNVLKYEANKQNFVLGETKEMIEEIQRTATNLVRIAKANRGTPIDTVAAHLEDKNLTPAKIKELQKYIDTIFDEDEDK